MSIPRPAVKRALAQQAVERQAVERQVVVRRAVEERQTVERSPVAARKSARSAGKCAGCSKTSNRTNVPVAIIGNCGTASGMSRIGIQEITMTPVAIPID